MFFPLAVPPASTNTVSPGHPRQFVHFGFLPLQGFTMLAFANAIEVLRMANYLERKEIYRWSIVGTDDGAVVASNGLHVAARRFDPDDFPDVIFVCGGIDAQRAVTAPLLTLLASAASRGVALGSLCTGAHALAQAGLLDGYTCATHWMEMAALQKAFPAVNFSRDLFVIDRDRLTCTGGIAPLDMMLNLIADVVDKATIAAIADQFILDHVRDHKDQQSIPLPLRSGATRPEMLEVLTLMEANLEEPLSLEDLAQLSRTSPRQLQRLFKEYVGMSPAHYYLTLRLEKARKLLRHSGMSITDITRACGFQSTSHFSKTYSDIFRIAPSIERRQPTLRTPLVPPPLLPRALPEKASYGPVRTCPAPSV